MKLFSPSGGLRYHARALRSRKRWRPFHAELETWLETWAIDKEHLILIGPSGGYSLPKRWLDSFQKVTAFDLDPLAATFFRFKHSPRAEFHKQDLFFENNALSLHPLQTCLERYPRAALLFCNVIGQLPIGRSVSEERWLQFLPELRRLLTGRRWASYHDIFTLEPLAESQHRSALENFRLHPEVTQQKGWKEVLDHGTYSEWSVGLTKTFFGWSLHPTSFHLIEGVRV